MSRFGFHPMKTSKVVNMPDAKKITITTIVHIPELIGFWKDSLKVLKLSFESLFKHTNQEFDFMVFDNGSCNKVNDYLTKEYKKDNIQYLYFSKTNQRKTFAMPFLLREAPGDIICFFDSDVLFLPNWLDESLKVLEKFPKTGMLTACPIAKNNRSPMYSSTYNDVLKDSHIEKKIGDDLIENYYVDSHALSVGMDPNIYKKNRLKEREDFLISHEGVSAYISAVDFQFITTKNVIESIMSEWEELSYKLRNSENKHTRGSQIHPPTFQILTNDKGFWKLSTKKYLVHHMGNKIPNISIELPWYNKSDLKIITTSSGKGQINKRKKGFILNSTRLRKLVKALHLWSYKFLYERK